MLLRSDVWQLGSSSTTFPSSLVFPHGRRLRRFEELQGFMGSWGVHKVVGSGLTRLAASGFGLGLQAVRIPKRIRHKASERSMFLAYIFHDVMLSMHGEARNPP